MPDTRFTFAVTVNVIRREKSRLKDMELATRVLEVLKERLDVATPDFSFDIPSIHPVMFGRAGGTPIDPSSKDEK